MKKIITILFILMTILFPVQTFGQQNSLVLNHWITNWTLLGPLPLEKSVNELEHLPGFEKDFLSKYGGESNPVVKTGKKVKLGSTKIEWTAYSGTDSIIDLDKEISGYSFIAAYAYTEIFVAEAKTYLFSLGTNDGGRLWVNGEQIWDYRGGRGCKPDDDLIPVFFKKGTNKILLKIEERGNKWEFCARVLPFNIETYTGNRPFFRVVTSTEGRPELRCTMEPGVVDDLFNAVNLEIYSRKGDMDLIWEGDWTKDQKMPLELKNQDYKPYLIKINAEEKDGKKWRQEIGFFAGKRIDYHLFDDKESDYRIIVGEDASESERWAASELQKYLSNISGADFKISGDTSKPGENEIIIGYNKHAQALLGSAFQLPDSLDEAYTYQNVKSNLILAGGKQRGTMYAVFSFLEDYFGVRWYTPDVTLVPDREKFVFNYIYHQEKPTLQVRNDFYYEAFDPEWAAHNKINGAMGYRKQEGGIEGYWAVHTFYQFMPPSEFYAEHPEYYSLIDGKRIHDHAQLCLTNPDVLDIITERLKQTMKENPTNLIYSVSQNDWRNPCQCDKCQAIARKEGSEAGVVVWFVNQVAERIKKDFPDKYVGTLAYQYTRKPPKKITPKENVVIRLCSIECCFAHDFESCPENQEFLADLEEWSSISPHLYIWDYVVNFSHYIMPYPNFRVLQPNIKSFIENKSIGIMEQGAYQSRGGEFAELRAYLISKLLWNADCNADEVINDFMYGYYGRSGQFIREYFDLLHNQITPNTHIHLGLRPDDKIFTDNFIRAADEIFDKAELISENDIIRKRVEMARLPLMYLKCKRAPLDSKYDGTYARFNEVVEREGITHFAEAGKAHMDAFHEQVKNAK